MDSKIFNLVGTNLAQVNESRELLEPLTNQQLSLSNSSSYISFHLRKSKIECQAHDLLAINDIQNRIIQLECIQSISDSFDELVHIFPNFRNC